MKKITITAYVNDECDAEKEIRDVLYNYNYSIPELVECKETIIEDTINNNYALLQLGMWSPLQSKGNNTRIIKLKELDLDEQSQSLYRDQILNGQSIDIEGPFKFIPLATGRNSQYYDDEAPEIMIRGAAIIDLNSEKNINSLMKLNADNLINKVSRLVIKKINGQYFALLRPLEPELIFESIKNVATVSNSIESFFNGQIYDKETLLNNDELYTYCIDTIKERINMENTEYFYNRLFNTLLGISKPTLVYHLSDKLISSGKLVLKWDTYKELLDLILTKIPRNMFIRSLTKYIYSNNLENQSDIYDELVGYILNKFGFITDEELEYSKMDVDSLPSNIEKMKYYIANIAKSCIYLSSYTDQKSLSWNFDIFVTTIRNYNNFMREQKQLYLQLSDNEKDIMFEWVKRVFKRFLILKELPNYSYTLFNSISIINELDYKERYMSTIFSILDEYKGMEVMTVRSIVKSGLTYDYNGENILNNVDKSYKRLRKLVFENKIKQD